MAIRQRRKQSGSGIRTIIRIGLKSYISSSMFQHLSTGNISSKSVHALLSNLANSQTNRQTRANVFTFSFVGGKNERTVVQRRPPISTYSSRFCRAMLYKRGPCRHAVSVRQSIRQFRGKFVNSVKTNKPKNVKINIGLSSKFFHRRVTKPF